jgi:hypothetical protein
LISIFVLQVGPAGINIPDILLLCFFGPTQAGLKKNPEFREESGEKLFGSRRSGL